jgi:hypothetical protein
MSGTVVEREIVVKRLLAIRSGPPYTSLRGGFRAGVAGVAGVMTQRCKMVNVRVV